MLRAKSQKLELENEKLQTENKKLSVQAIRGAKKELEKPSGAVDMNKIKEELKLMELERDELKEKVKSFMEASIKKLPERTPKKYSDSLTKPQIKVRNENTIFTIKYFIYQYLQHLLLQKLIEDLELEVIEARAMVSKIPGSEKKTDSKVRIFISTIFNN